MNGECLDAAARVAAADPNRALPEAQRAHLDGCQRCRDEVAAFRELAQALAALGDAERRAAPSSSALVSSVLARLERPARGDRLPIALAAAWRTGTDLARPAFVASCVALAAGAGTGTWLARAAQAQHPSTAEADVFAASNLDGSVSDTFEAAFLNASEVADESALGSTENGDGNRDGGDRGDAGSADTTADGDVR